MWGQYDSYLTAARDVFGLRVPAHAKYAAWEQAAIHGGFRYLHPKFCLVSDFPELLLTDDQHRPHCDTGPSHRWRDGWSIYHVHGVGVPAYVVEHPESITAQHVAAEQNAEVRRVMLERMGAERFTAEAGAVEVHRDDWGRLLRCALRDTNGQPYTYIEVVNSTPEPDGSFQNYLLAVPPTMRTAKQAWFWGFDLPVEDEIIIEVQT